MDIRNRKLTGREMKARIVIKNIHSEIDVGGWALLRLEAGQPGDRVMCTAGTLWLTQQGDPHDHLLNAGQSFTLDQRGVILVQGLPRGKALILPPSSIGVTAGTSPPRPTQI